DNLTWSYDTDTKALTIEGTGDMSYNEVPWTQVKSDIVSVSFPDGLTSIGGSAFQGCSNLTSITIPNSVTSMGDFVFYDCFSLTSVTLGNSVTSIGQCTFRHCSALTSITIPNSVTSIGWVAFEGCSSLTSVIIGNSVTNIDSHAFHYCTALTSVILGNSVTRIGEGAFCYCPLTSITIPNSVTNIGKDAFHDCSQVIVECTTPPTIESGTFRSDASIFVPCSESETYLQTAVWQFLDLKGLNYTVNLSATEGGKAHITATDCDANTATIEAKSDECMHFVQWSDGNTDNPRTLNLTQDTTLVAQFESTTYQINISAAEHGSLTYYGDPIDNIETTMTDCGGYGEWINNICAVPDEGYYFTGWSDGYADACRSIEVVSDTTLVAHFAEKQQVQVLVGVESACKNMGTVSGSGIFYQGDVVTITATPKSGYHFVEWSDGNSIANREIVLASDTTLFATFAAGDMGGKCGDNLTWSYDTDTKALTIEGTGAMTDYEYDNQPWAQVQGDILSVSLPEGLTSIGDGAFWECSALTSIILPNSVTTIGGDAFSGCSSLTSITFPNSVTSIGYGAFWHCSSLTSLTIPNSVTSIEGSTFGECYSLTSITIPNSVTSIGGYAFYNCSALTSVTLGNSVNSIGESAFYGCYSLTFITGGKCGDNLYWTWDNGALT
ncbi:MAG: leucine-rich repeat protein, partial [Paludibacteraceae bacterium]